MRLNFEQRIMGETTYLVLDVDDDYKIDTFAMDMMSYNPIANIVPVQIVQKNEKKQAQFGITGMTKLAKRLDEIIPKKEALGLLGSIVNAFEETDAYMLDPGCLFLDWEYVYLDAGGNCRFLYLPFAGDFSNSQLVFLREAVSRIRQDEQENDPYLYDILNAFGRGAVRKLSDFRELLKKSAGVFQETCAKKQAPEETESHQAEQREERAVPPQAEQENRILGIGKKRQEEKPALEKKAVAAASIPLINIPGREPGKKTAATEPEGKNQKAAAIGPEGKNQKVADPEPEGKGQKARKEKELKKGLFHRKNIQKSSDSLGRQKNAAMAIPGAAAGKSMPVKEERNVVLGSTDSRQEEMYESYEATVIMQEPMAMPEEGTILLEGIDAPRQRAARLVRRQGGFSYWINGGRMTVGSSQTADIQIDNKAVSRSHATVVSENGQFYIVDNGSKNGSYIEGKRLRPGVKEAVHDGMMVKFADEEFAFLES